MRIPFCLLLAALSLCAQDFSDIKIEKVAAGHIFTEGPAWSRDGFLVYSDVPASKLFKLTAKGKEELRSESNGANGNIFDAKGNLYTCENRSRRVSRTDKDGNVESLAEQWQGKRLNAPNDIVVRKDGHIYFTDPAFGKQADTRELDFYGIYHIPPKGEMELVAKPKGRPNGIVLSPDGRILYVSNSDDRRVYAYDVDRRGAASNERVLIDNIDGPPDGMCIDEKGNLYVTCNRLAIYSPKGELIHSIEIPEKPSNCAFGDNDLGTLYVTARTSVYRIRLTEVKGSVQY